MSTISIKVNTTDDAAFRRFSVPDSMAFDEFMLRIAQIFPGVFEVYWTDDDNEEIVIKSDEELKEAFRLTRLRPSLKITLKPTLTDEANEFVLIDEPVINLMDGVEVEEVDSNPVPASTDEAEEEVHCSIESSGKEDDTVCKGGADADKESSGEYSVESATTSNIHSKSEAPGDDAADFWICHLCTATNLMTHASHCCVCETERPTVVVGEPTGEPTVEEVSACPRCTIELPGEDVMVCPMCEFSFHESKVEGDEEMNLFSVIGDAATEAKEKLTRTLSDFGEKAKPHLISFGESAKSKSVDAIDELKLLYNRISTGAVAASEPMVNSIKNLIQSNGSRSGPSEAGVLRAVHDIDCSECGEYIIGIRYTSVLVTPIGSYNLCSDCESKIDIGHPLLKLKIPENVETFRLSNLKLHLTDHIVTAADSTMMMSDTRDSTDNTADDVHENEVSVLRSLGFTDLSEEELLTVLKEEDSIDDAINRLLDDTKM